MSALAPLPILAAPAVAGGALPFLPGSGASPVGNLPPAEGWETALLQAETATRPAMGVNVAQLLLFPQAGLPTDELSELPAEPAFLGEELLAVVPGTIEQPALLPVEPLPGAPELAEALPLFAAAAAATTAIPASTGKALNGVAASILGTGGGAVGPTSEQTTKSLLSDSPLLQAEAIKTAPGLQGSNPALAASQRLGGAAARSTLASAVQPLPAGVRNLSGVAGPGAATAASTRSVGTLDHAPWLELDEAPAAAASTEASSRSLPAGRSQQVRSAIQDAVGSKLSRADDGARIAHLDELTEAPAEDPAGLEAPMDEDIAAPHHRSRPTTVGAVARPVGLAAEPAAPTGTTPAPESAAVLEPARTPTTTQRSEVAASPMMQDPVEPGAPGPEAAIPEPDVVDLQVDDGESALRVTLAREADGLSVQVRAPREVVPELRALEPDIDAALSEEGQELSSYDAFEQAEDGRGEPEPERGPRHAPSSAAEPVRRATTPAADAAPPGQGQILSRRA